jgi:hypothetical protein
MPVKNTILAQHNISNPPQTISKPSSLTSLHICRLAIKCMWGMPGMWGPCAHNTMQELPELLGPFGGVSNSELSQPTYTPPCPRELCAASQLQSGAREQYLSSPTEPQPSCSDLCRWPTRTGGGPVRHRGLAQKMLVKGVSEGWVGGWAKNLLYRTYFSHSKSS